MCSHMAVKPDYLPIRLYPYLNIAGYHFEKVVASVFLFLRVYPIAFTIVQLSTGNHHMYKSHFTAFKKKIYEWHLRRKAGRYDYF